MDLLRSSAETTSILIEDFRQADGYLTITDFVSRYFLLKNFL